MLLLLAGLVVGWGIGDGWGSAQWGPVAAWFSGLLTVVAVGVALYQTIMARRDTEIARAEAAKQVATARADAEAQRLQAVEERAIAEARHAQQLQNSEELLARQLDAQQRSDQVATLPPIWAAIGRLQLPFQNFAAFLDDDLLPLVLAVDRDAGAAELQRNMHPWMELLSDLELVFTPAQMIVGQPEVFDSLNDLYEETRKLQKLSNTLLLDCNRTRRAPDTHEFRMVFQRILQQRRVMIRLVREHLTQVPPLTRKFTWSETIDTEA